MREFCDFSTFSSNHFWSLILDPLGLHFGTPRSLKTVLDPPLGRPRAAPDNVFWGPRASQEASKRPPRGERPPEQIRAPPRTLYNTISHHIMHYTMHYITPDTPYNTIFLDPFKEQKNTAESTAASRAESRVFIPQERAESRAECGERGWG